MTTTTTTLSPDQPTTLTTSLAPGRVHRRRPSNVAWAGLLVMGALPIFAAVADLVSDRRTGIPADHQAAFHSVTGMTVTGAHTALPGVMHYIHNLEVGYAVHEVVFGVLFLAVVAIPLRLRQRWAWLACWAVLLADITYTATFGAYDPTILRQSLIAVIGLPILLLAIAPSVFRHSARSRND